LSVLSVLTFLWVAVKKVEIELSKIKMSNQIDWSKFKKSNSIIVEREDNRSNITSRECISRFLFLLEVDRSRTEGSINPVGRGSYVKGNASAQTPEVRRP